MRAPRHERLAPLNPDDPRTIGAYTIRGVLGSGGMGVVYFAEQQRPKRSVAVKVMRPGALGESTRQRFEMEAELLGRLQHPGIAQIFEAGTDGERHSARAFLAMEYIDGISLIEYAEENELDVTARVGLIMQLAEAVHHAHQRGVLHRDLKPANALVTDAGEVKVIDFGVARLMDEGDQGTRLTVDGHIIGTLAYMCPEQLRGEIGALDTRVDVYGMGVIAYELLAGRLPFDLDLHSLTGGIKLICEEDPPLLGQRNPECRGDLEAIVSKCMEKDAERRYPSASALAADLRRFLAGETVHARATGSFYQLAKFARRNRALVIGSVTTLIALVAGLIGTGWGWLSARQANRELAVSNDRLQEVNADLERVASFQADQLSGVDIMEMATSLRRATIDQTPADRQAGLEEALSTVNFVDVALENLEQNLFRPSLTSIDQNFGSQPLVQAQLLEALVIVALPLGLQDLAREAQGQAVSLRRELQGDDAPETLTAILKQSEILQRCGEYEESEALSRRCFEARQRLLGDDHLDTLAAKSHLAQALQQKNELEAAEEMFRDLHVRTRQALGDEDSRSQRCALNLSSVLRQRGQYREAESLIREVFVWRSENLGAEHVDTLNSKEILSSVLDDLGEVEEAVRLSREVLEARRRTLGDEHPDSARCMGELAARLQRCGQREEAGALFREALASGRSHLGEGHPSTMMALARLADWELDGGNAEAAEAMYREAWENLSRIFGPEHTRALRAAGSLGQALNQLGRYREAEPLYRMALEHTRDRLGERHPTTLTCLTNMGVLLIDLGRPEEASPLLHEALELRTEVLGSAHPSTLNSYYNLGHLFQNLGRYGEAIAPLRIALENYEESLGPDSIGALFSRGKLGEILLQNAEYGEAEALLEVLLERRRELFGELHPANILVLEDLLSAKQALGKWDESEEMILAYFSQCEGNPGLEPDARRRVSEFYWARHGAQPGEGYDALAEDWR